MLLSAEHLSFTYGTKPLLTDVSLYLNAGDKLGIIGINGTGKSTLLRILAGRAHADAGVLARNPNVQVSFLEQNPVMHDEMTVLEQIFAEFPPEFRTLREYEAVTMSRFFGAGDGARLKRELATTILFGALLSLGLAIPGFLLARPLLALLRVPDEALGMKTLPDFTILQ